MSQIDLLTPEDRHHFFGYYYFCPWSPDGRHIAFLYQDLDHPTSIAEVGSKAGIVLYDTQEKTSRTIAHTLAWNWHQGSMLQWLPDGSILSNHLEGDRPIAIAMDTEGRELRRWNRAFFNVDGQGQRAICLSFERLCRWRTVNGYSGCHDSDLQQLCPEDEGLTVVDLATGKETMVLSLAQASRLSPRQDMVGAGHWFNHVHWNPSGTRFLVTYRWFREGQKGLLTQCLCFDADGGRPSLMVDGIFSHWDWEDDETVVAWCEVDGRRAFWRMKDRPDCLEPVREGDGAEVFAAQIDRDGHGTFSPDRSTFLTDSPLEKWGGYEKHHLSLYHIHSDEVTHLESFHKNPDYQGSFRCDVHPRWNRDGSEILFDTSRNGVRQVGRVKL